MTRLSKNFTLDEFLVSQTAARHGIDMTPSPRVIDNLERLCETCLQPVRDELGVVIYISSGYRPTKLNSLIGGSKTSAHRHGRAADFNAVGHTPYEIVKIVADMGLPFDQVIHEFGQWVHLGIAEELPRRQVLTADRRDGSVIYLPGLQEVQNV